MKAALNRINWPFAAIMLFALAAIVGRIILTQHLGVPRFFRHHMADLFFVAFFTFFIVAIAAPFRRRNPKRINIKRRRLWWMSIPVIGTLLGLWIELEDYLGIDDDDGGFDPGAIISWTGAPNTDTFDPLDLMYIALGGILVFILHRLSVRLIDRWRGFPLLLKTT